ncbi:MAG: hypothetical protein U0325_08865 [Polyangiales bacterium]
MTPSIAPTLPNAPLDPEPPRRTGVDHGTNDRGGVVTGIFLAVLVHATVAGAALRLGHDEGNVARPQTAPREELVVSTPLLRRGGGLFDPRRVIHREAPVRAERPAPNAITPTRDPTAVALRQDAGAQDYMAAITNRRVQGRGNQDLAEAMNRIAQMAAAEQAADPTASGPGDPNGSTVGTTTDPNQASHGVVAKLQDFFQRNIHRAATVSGSERLRVRFRVRVGGDGTLLSAEVSRGTGNATADADFASQAQALVAQHAQIPNLTPEELTYVSGLAGINFVVEPPSP